MKKRSASAGLFSYWGATRGVEKHRHGGAELGSREFSVENYL
ncbi:MAG: hypothetical protein AAB507_00405 [Patescibacteria group bacterium]